MDIEKHLEDNWNRIKVTKQEKVNEINLRISKIGHETGSKKGGCPFAEIAKINPTPHHVHTVRSKLLKK